jgi:hypothetical protein
MPATWQRAVLLVATGALSDPERTAMGIGLALTAMVIGYPLLVGFAEAVCRCLLRRSQRIALHGRQTLGRQGWSARLRRD